MKFLGKGPEGILLKCSEQEYELLEKAERALLGNPPWPTDLSKDLSPLFKIIHLLSTEVEAVKRIQGSLDALKSILGMNTNNKQVAP